MLTTPKFRTAAPAQIAQIVRVLAGCCIFAAGLNLFVIPTGLYSGGVVGLTQLFDLAWRNFVPGGAVRLNMYGLFYFLLNVPVLIIAWAKLGPAFLFKTLIGTAGISIFTALIPQSDTPLVSDAAAAIMIGGVITGLGVGVMLTAGGSGGGVEVIGIWLSKKHPDFSVGKLVGGFNAALFLAYFFLFDRETVIYSILYMAIYSFALDKTYYQNINARVMIFTKRAGIDEALMTRTGRGVTEWDGCGAFTKADSHILVSIINKYEIDEVVKIIHSVDPEAFVVIDEGLRVYGNFQRRL